MNSEHSGGAHRDGQNMVMAMYIYIGEYTYGEIYGITDWKSYI